MHHLQVGELHDQRQSCHWVPNPIETHAARQPTSASDVAVLVKDGSGAAQHIQTHTAAAVLAAPRCVQATVEPTTERAESWSSQLEMEASEPPSIVHYASRQKAVPQHASGTAALVSYFYDRQDANEDSARHDGAEYQRHAEALARHKDGRPRMRRKASHREKSPSRSFSPNGNARSQSAIYSSTRRAQGEITPTHRATEGEVQFVAATDADAPPNTSGNASSAGSAEVRTTAFAAMMEAEAKEEHDPRSLAI
jgi:hypothetical protein